MAAIDLAVRAVVRAAGRGGVPDVRGEHEVVAAVRVVGDRGLRRRARAGRGQRAAPDAMKRVAAATLLAMLAACTSGGPPRVGPTTTPTPRRVHEAGPSAAEEIAKLCPQLELPKSKVQHTSHV